MACSRKGQPCSASSRTAASRCGGPLREFGARFGEVLEVDRRPGQALAGTVEPQPVIAITGPHARGPAPDVIEFLAGYLGEQMEGQPDRQCSAVSQPCDRRVVLGEGLETAGRVDRGCQPEPVQLVQEMPGRLELAVFAEHRRLPDRGVQQVRRGRRQQHPGRLPVVVADDLPAGHLRGVAGVSSCPQGGAVQQDRLVQVGDHDRGIRRSGVQLADRGQPLLGELLLAPPSYHPYPLAWRGAARLVAEYRQRLAQRPHAVPAQLQQVVQPGPDHVNVRVDEARDDPPAHRVDHAGGPGDVPGHAVIVADGQDPAVVDRHRGCVRAAGITGVDAAVAHHEVGGIIGPLSRDQPGHWHRHPGMGCGHARLLSWSQVR